MTMTVQLVICDSCGNGVYTRCVGDSRSCSCGSISVTQDSFGFNRIESIDSYTTTDVEIKQSEESLYVDFEDANDKFGVVNDGNKFASVVKSNKDLKIKPRRFFGDDIQDLASIW